MFSIQSITYQSVILYIEFILSYIFFNYIVSNHRIITMIIKTDFFCKICKHKKSLNALLCLSNCSLLLSFLKFPYNYIQTSTFFAYSLLLLLQYSDKFSVIIHRNSSLVAQSVISHIFLIISMICVIGSSLLDPIITSADDFTSSCALLTATPRSALRTISASFG